MNYQSVIVTPHEARKLRDLHFGIAESISSNSKSNLSNVVRDTTLAVISKFIGLTGTVTSVATLLWDVVQADNSTIVENYFRGAGFAFMEVNDYLITGSYTRGDVSMMWTTYPSVSTNCKFAMGNPPPNVKSGYDITRVQQQNGNWLETPRP